MRRTSSGVRCVALAGALLLGGVAAGCAQQALPGAREDAIVGGSRESGYPEVMLVYNRAGGLCTSALISPRVVLTARHCVTAGGGSTVTSPSNIAVYVGSSIRSLTAEYRVRQIYVVPGSTGAIGDGTASDVALLELTAPAGEEPRAIARDINPGSLVGTPITAIGYGQTPSGDGQTKYRTTAQVNGYQYGLIFVEPAVCQGDSGGPLIGGDGQIYGVASFIFSPDGRTEPQCGTAPGAYNEIWRHIDWIDGILESIGDACIPDDGGEVCNGLDDDCDEMVDEGCSPLGTACTDGSTCIGGLCAETIDGMLCTQECDPARPAFGCPPGFYCGARGCAGHCVPGSAGDAPVGAACADDTECASLFCVDPGDGMRRCLDPCRLDEGRCLAGEICLPHGDSCGGCIDERIVSGLGHGLGEPCRADADCRSGTCYERGGIRECADPCGADGTCPAGFACREALCVRSRGGGIGTACIDNADCGMGVCASSGGRSWCTAQCTDASTCPAGFDCIDAGGVRVCAPSLGLVGDACAAGSECVSGVCAMIGGDGTCVQVCDADNACGVGFECRRASDGSVAVCARPVSEGGGCAVAHGGRGGGWSIVPLGLALALVIARRRRAR